MSLGVLTYRDFLGASQDIAARFVNSAWYPMDAGPEILVARIIAADGVGDPTVISAVPCVLRALRLFNGGSVPYHAKIHNVAGTPVVGVAGVVYSVTAQAGASNPDQHVAAGGLALSVGLGLTLVTGIANNSTAGVTAATAIIVVEYHLA